MRVIRDRLADRQDGEGFTLVELLVSMFLFVIVLALVASATLVMEHGLRKSQGQSDNLDASRKVLLLLDRQVRYANAITQPGVGATPTATYVEWQSGDTNQQQTCTQWRFDSAAGTLAYRTWPVPTVTGAPVTPTGWVTEAFGVSRVGSAPVFTTTALPVGAVVPSGTTASHASVSVAFALKHGARPSTTSASQVTLTAVNTTSLATPSAVCNQVTRP